MVRGLSDHLDLLENDETSPVSGLSLSKRSTRRHVTSAPPPPSSGATYHESLLSGPPPPPPPGTPPSRQREPPALHIVSTGPTELSASYRRKKRNTPRIQVNTGFDAGTSGPLSNRSAGRSTPNSIFDRLSDPPAQGSPSSSQFDGVQKTPTIPHSHQQPQKDPPLGSPTATMLADTVREISTVASGTFDKIREWGNNGSLYQDLGFSTPKSEASRAAPPLPTSPLMKNGAVASSGTPTNLGSNKFNYDENQGLEQMDLHNMPHVVMPNKSTPRLKHRGKNKKSSSQPTILQDLAWPFMACSTEMAQNLNLPNRDQLEPQLQKMKDAVNRAMHGNMSTPRELWRITAGATTNTVNAAKSNTFGNDDNHTVNDDMDTVFTYDTKEEEENNQIRRLGSWGTIGTAGTTDTDTLSLRSKSMDDTTAFGELEDDDGNLF